MSVFRGDNCLTVTTMGPGKLTLLTYGGSSANHIGAKSTNNSSKTRWMIGFSHNYTRFAFIWEGKGEAVYRVGSSLVTTPVGTSWTAASLMDWGTGKITRADVSSNILGAIERNNATTFWVIPDTI